MIFTKYNRPIMLNWNDYLTLNQEVVRNEGSQGVDLRATLVLLLAQSVIMECTWQVLPTGDL